MIIRFLLGLVELLAAVCEIITSSISGLLAILRVQLYKQWDYRTWLKRDLADCKSILELGCGANSPILQIGYGKRTSAIDIWQPYVNQHLAGEHYRNCWQGDILTEQFYPKSYDAVVICDVLEHLPKDRINGLFNVLSSVARKKVIIFTPNGELDNDITDGNSYQGHLSTWEPKDYEKQGYKVFGATGLRHILGKGARPKYHPYSVMEIIAMLSQPYIYSKPGLAIHSYAIKELNGKSDSET